MIEKKMKGALYCQLKSAGTIVDVLVEHLERVAAESMEGIAKMEAEIKALEEEPTKETLIYNVNYAKNSEELTRRQNDLDVFQFILTFTRCEDYQEMNRSTFDQVVHCKVGGTNY